MATLNPFALLGEDENDDPAAIIARVGAAPVKEAKKPPPSQQPSAPAKLPTKPPPPAQAVRDSRTEGGRGRGGGRGGGRGNFGNRDRGSDGGYNRPNRENASQGERGDYNDRNYRNGGEYRGGRGGFSSGNAVQNGDLTAPRDDGEGRFSQEVGRGRGRGRGRSFFADGEEQGGRRMYDRRSGSGRGNEIKRDGAGRGNWGVELDQNATEEVIEAAVVEEKPGVEPTEKKPEEVAEADSGEKKEAEEEDKEMTLEEYEKVLAEKRKVLVSLRAEARKVTVDKEFASMQLVDKKVDEEIFLKLGSDKGKKKELLDKEERAKKSVSINEFLRPAEGESMYGRRGRGGRGRGDRGGFRGFGGSYNSREAVTAPRIEDPGQFPTLGGK